MLLDELEQRMAESIRAVMLDLMEPPKQTFADKAHAAVSMVTYTIFWWAFMIPVVTIGSLFRAIRDLLDEL